MLPKIPLLAIFLASFLTTGFSHLNFSSPSPYIFSSVPALLSQWSNTFFPNGHTIAACKVPKQTLLYHGRIDTSAPPSPEWLAFDIEMSYGIMGNDINSRILTYRTTREVKCIYFDGTSANLMGSGTEAQMTFLYGDSESVPKRPGPGRGRRPPGKGHRGSGPPHGGPPGDRLPGYEPPSPPTNSTDGRWNPLTDEYFRARGLCKWIEEKGLGGLGWGYEGIIRMNAGFEMIWCNFTSPSLQLVSNLNVSAPRLMGGRDQKDPRRPSRDRQTLQLPLGSWFEKISPLDEGPHGPGMTDPSEPFRGAANWMWFTAAARRYRGEVRARVQTCGIFSFYNHELSDQNKARIQEEISSLNLTKDGEWDGFRLSEPEREFALAKLMRRRRSHRTNHVSKEDGVLMQQNVKKVLREALNETKCSGIDWHLTTQEIFATYAQNLQHLPSLLEPSSSADSRTWLQEVRGITHWLILPFFEYPHGPYTPSSLHRDFSIHSSSAKSALERCKSQYTQLSGETLIDSESMIASAVEDTLSSICNTIFEVGLEVEIMWLEEFNTVPSKSEEQETDEIKAMDLIAEAKSWKNRIEELNAWLGWVDQWTNCGKCKTDVSLTSTLNLFIFISKVMQLFWEVHE
jgi:hypothetical protein